MGQRLSSGFVRLCLTGLVCISNCAWVPAADPPAQIRFDRDIQPILQTRCLSCHGPDKQKSGFRVDRRDAAMKGGDSGIAIVPGKSAASALIQRVTSADKDERMPPTGERLTAEQIAWLRAWIDQGARWDEAVATRDPRKEHWAFQPLARPTVPQIVNWKLSIGNSIDAFTLDKLAANRLALSPEADRAALIRRLKFDLLGLPPTPEEVDAFVADRDTRAYEKLVERYLASPQFGERWARHWLDVVRFAESHGFEMNQPRPNAWPYRDYVIRSLNDDKPYDRFVIEQLAGDVVGADEATGFLVGGPWDQVKSPDQVLTLQQRADELHDIVSTTGSTFLGLTVGCARCHNHKFDPISQTDYYAVRAVFAGVQHGERPRCGAEPRRQEADELRRQMAALMQELEQFEPLAAPNGSAGQRLPVNPRRNVERFAPVLAKYVRFTVLATNNLEPGIDELEIFAAGPSARNVALASAGARATSSGDFSAAPAIHRLEHINDGKYGNSRSWISNEFGRGWVQIELKEATPIERIVWGRDREGKFSDRLPVAYRIEVALKPGEWTLVASADDRLPVGAKDKVPPALSAGQRDAFERLTKKLAELERRLAEAERVPMLYAGQFVTAEPTFRLHRGDPMQKREPVAPGSLSEFGAKIELPATTPEAQRRLALAKWIADPKNPLTARVLVNRLWHYHFGQGIVNTPSDFGLNGAKPSHPELLDWLATEFIRSGWSMKAVHRLIVLSATYRQSSRSTPEGLAADAGSRLLWRYPPRRLEAEPLRDAILFVTGKLDERMGGPGFDLFEPNTNYVRVYAPKQTFGPAEFRRMIYQNKPRMQLEDTFGAFDCPDGGQIMPKRSSSTTPLQALNLLNGRFMVQQAGFLAERIEREAGADVTKQVQRGFRLTFQREPTTMELAAGVALVREHGLPALCRALLNANEFVYVN